MLIAMNYACRMPYDDEIKENDSELARRHDITSSRRNGNVKASIAP